MSETIVHGMNTNWIGSKEAAELAGVPIREFHQRWSQFVQAVGRGGKGGKLYSVADVERLMAMRKIAWGLK